MALINPITAIKKIVQKFVPESQKATYTLSSGGIQGTATAGTGLSDIKITTPSPIQSPTPTTTTTTTTTRTTSGGGGSGGSISPITPVASTPQGTMLASGQIIPQSIPPTQTQAPIGADVPKSYSGVVTKAPSGIPAATSIARTILRDEAQQYKGQPLQKEYQAGKAFVGIGLIRPFTEGFKKPAEKIIEKAEQKTYGALESGVPTYQIIKRYDSDVKSFNEKSEKLDIRIELFNREVEKYPEGAPSGVFEKLKAEELNLNKELEKRQQQYEMLKQQEEIIKDIQAGKGTAIQKADVTAVAIVKGVTGAAFFVPKLLVSPKKTITEQAEAVIDTPSAIKEAPLPTIAGTIASIATFYVGGKVIGRVVGGKAVDPVKLNAALETAEIKTIKTSGKVTETNINAYKLPVNVQAEAVGNLRAGNSVRVVEYDIVARNKAQQKIINQGLPNRKITSIEVTDSVGNVISRKTLIGVELRKGIITYKDYTTGAGEGEYNPATKTATIESVYVRGKVGKPITEIYKELEVIKPEVTRPVRLTTGDIIRGAQARSLTFEAMTKTATKEKPLTFKDLREVAQSEAKKIPVRTASAKEIQKITGVEDYALAIRLRLGEAEKGIGFIGRDVTYNILKSKGSAQRIPKPVEFEKTISRKMKPFEEPKPPEVPKDIIDLSSGQKQVLKKSSEALDITQITSKDLAPQIQKSIQEGAMELSKFKSPELKMADLTSELNRDLNRVWQDTGLSVKDITELEENLKKQGVTTIQTTKTSSIPKIKEREIVGVAQPNVEKLKEIEKTITKQLKQPIVFPPTPTIPKIIPKIPKIPNIFGFGLPAHQQGVGSNIRKTLRKERKKLETQYTASLAAAALQTKPIKITKKQLEKLSKKTYTGFETRPVIELIEEPKKKKSKQSVVF